MVMKGLITAVAAFAVVLGTGGTAEAAKPKKKNANTAASTTDAAFAKLDTNNDGKLTKAEFMKLPSVMPAAAGLANPKKPGKKPGKGATATSLDELFNKLAKADTNTISKEDFRAVTSFLPKQKKAK
jgi:hypothetical protein